MKRSVMTGIAVLTPVLSLAQTSPAVAAAAAPPLPLTLLLFAGACACVVFCFQVFALVRGGQLSKSWLLLMSGFAVLAISQLIVLLGGFGVIENSRYLVPSVLIIMSGLFLFGLWETKRTLS